jgi:hypothetical protein
VARDRYSLLLLVPLTVGRSPTAGSALLAVTGPVGDRPATPDLSWSCRLRRCRCCRCSRRHQWTATVATNSDAGSASGRCRVSSRLPGARTADGPGCPSSRARRRGRWAGDGDKADDAKREDVHRFAPRLVVVDFAVRAEDGPRPLASARATASAANVAPTAASAAAVAPAHVEPAFVRIPTLELLVGVTPARPMVRVEAPVELEEEVEDRDGNDNGRGNDEFHRIAGCAATGQYGSRSTGPQGSCRPTITHGSAWPARPGHGGSRPPQGRAQLLGEDLDGGPGAAVLGGPCPLLEPAHDHDPAAPAQRFGSMLGLRM